jgi:SnoaL-like protein
MNPVREALKSGDFERFIAAFDPDAVWVGVDPSMVCANRDEIEQTMRTWMNEGGTVDPEIVAEIDSAIVVDVRPEPPLTEGGWPPLAEGELHQIFRIENGRIVRLEDYANRQAALAAAGVE